jgi:hypothetical protein
MISQFTWPNFHGGSAEEGTRVSLSRTLSIAYSFFVPVHCNENPIYVFLFCELRGLSPNFHIHVSVSVLYIPRIGPHIFLQKNRQIERGNIEIAHRHMNVEIGTVAAQFLFWEYLIRIFGIGSLQCGSMACVFCRCCWKTEVSSVTSPLGRPRYSFGLPPPFSSWNRRGGHPPPPPHSVLGLLLYI